MIKRGTVWMMALMFAASLLAAPAAMAHKAGVQGPQKGQSSGVNGFHRKMWFKEEWGGGEKSSRTGNVGNPPATVPSRRVIANVIQFYSIFLVRR